MPRLVCTLLVAIAIMPAAAMPQGLYGHTITADWLHPDFGTVLESHDVVAGPGVELPTEVIINATGMSIDIGETTVRFEFLAETYWSYAIFNGWRFADTNHDLPAFGGYRVLEYSAGVTGVDQIITGFDSEAVWADFGGVVVAAGGGYLVMGVDLTLFADGFETGNTTAWSTAVP